MTNRRDFLIGSAALLGACTTTATAPAATPFVRREGTRLMLDGQRYRFAGANMWYASYLGADAPVGNRDRLRRELDRLVDTGITNLRILASSEESPLRDSVTPSFRNSSPNYNEALLRGLDFTLAEMGRRNLRAVLYLTNFWEWSGGMMTYLYWTNGGRYIDMKDPAHPWPAFADFNADFYRSGEAMRRYRHYVRTLVGRTNSVTGRPYAEDPAIMAWQLANEPRPGGGEAVARRTMPDFYTWIGDTARLIKALDPNHLVSTGSEGLKGCVEDADCVLAAHRPAEIDYLTAHIWPQNWEWVDANDLPGTFATGEANTRNYLAQHIALAETAGKPLVVEEFGFPRDDASFDPAASTQWRDRFYGLIFDAVEAGGPIAGSNFWAWGGEGRAASAEHRWQPGAAHLMGDPPHEPQGWYSVFDSDRSTRERIRAHSTALGQMVRG